MSTRTITEGRPLRALLLAGLLGAPACGGLPNPVLLLKVSNIPPCAGALAFTASSGGKAASPVLLFRSASNEFKDLSLAAKPPDAAAPTTASLALDLPAATRGPVTVTVAARWGAMMMAPPEQWSEIVRATETVSVDGATLLTGSVALPGDTMMVCQPPR